MPPPNYLWIHPDARLSSDELKAVQDWAFAKYKTAQTTVGSQNTGPSPRY
jgi:hypothetical protein